MGTTEELLLIMQREMDVVQGVDEVAAEVNFQISSREPAVGSIVDGRPLAATPTNADIHSPLNILLLILVRESDSIFHVWLLTTFKSLPICFPFLSHILSEMLHTDSFGDGGRFTTCHGLSLS